MAVRLPVSAHARTWNVAIREWRRWWPWTAGGLVVLLLCLGWLLLPMQQWINGLQSWLQGLGTAGVVICVLILFFTTFLPAPDWPLPVAAGYVYGFWAIPMVYGSVGLASIVAFLVARFLARDRMRALLQRNPKYATFDKVIAKEGWQTVVLLRLSPVIPFNLQNYALAVSAIPFKAYLGATLVGIIPGIAIYVYFGVFGQGLGGNGIGLLDWALFAAGIVATIALGILVGGKTKEKFAEAKVRRRRRAR
jgi:uncharacterized membrane protein YdjX (TVP38/TMEM64 family)